MTLELILKLLFFYYFLFKIEVVRNTGFFLFFACRFLRICFWSKWIFIGGIAELFFFFFANCIHFCFRGKTEITVMQRAGGIWERWFELKLKLVYLAYTESSVEILICFCLAHLSLNFDDMWGPSRDVCWNVTQGLILSTNTLITFFRRNNFVFWLNCTFFLGSLRFILKFCEKF